MDLNPKDLVLWSDEHILLINKPSGLLSLPDGYDPSLPHLKSVLEPAYGRLWIAHRLDRETSGIIVLGRSRDAHRQLSAQFEGRKVEKTYHALVIGIPSWDEERVEYPLRPDGDRMHRTIIDPERGKAAQTDFQVLQRFEVHSLVEATPTTGRTHQIRAHLSAIGFPLIGDLLYGDKHHPAHGLLGRLGLHALSLAFDHPHSRERLRFNAPYPSDFGAAISVVEE
jgi:tRNA pseudouridine32 synthase/23S rRNA pseudouridine746 synthase